jgi:hypothetical protein
MLIRATWARSMAERPGTHVSSQWGMLARAISPYRARAHARKYLAVRSKRRKRSTNDESPFQMMPYTIVRGRTNGWTDDTHHLPLYRVAYLGA